MLKRQFCLAIMLLAFVVASPLAGQARKPSEDDRKEAVARLRKINSAIWKYFNGYQRYPPAAMFSADGKPLLSWRVLLLPHLGEEKLFREFKLEQPWDSPHNKKLLAQMPKAYEPVAIKYAKRYLTPYQVFTGPGTIFEGSKACRIADVTDGVSNTLLIVEAAEPVPWTKPADVPYDTKKPIRQMGGMFPGIFLCLTADGAIHFGKRDFDESTMRLAILRNDGTPINPAGLYAPDQP